MKKVALGDLTASTRPICYGVLKPGDRVPNGVPLIRVTDITNNRFDASDLYTISKSLDNEFRRSRLEGGELLLSIQGTVGRVAICPPEYAGANISRTIAVIAPDERASRAYLYHYLRHLGASGGFHTVGTTRASLNIAAIRRLQIPLPPLPEQKHIAAILDAADALRAKRRESIEQLDSLVQATFLEMFGDPVTNPRNWPQCSFIEACDIQGGTQPPKEEWVAEPKSGYVRMLQIRDFTQADRPKIEYVKDTGRLKKCDETDILLGRYGASVGKVLYGLAGAYNVAITKCLPDKQRLGRGYLLAWLNADYFQTAIKKVGSRAAQAGFNKDDLSQLTICLPPLDLQTRFASIVESIEQQKARLKAHLAELDTLFASLQSRAFNGELVA